VLLGLKPPQLQPLPLLEGRELLARLGLGVVGTVDYALGPPATLIAGLLRAEYRVGW